MEDQFFPSPSGHIINLTTLDFIEVTIGQVYPSATKAKFENLERFDYRLA